MLDTNINKVTNISDEERMIDDDHIMADRGLRKVNYDDFLPYR